jgi:ABC-type lipoprotein release transport system permease subunit
MDPLTHGAVALLAVTTVALAVGAPLRRALRVDPVESLRQA